MDQRTLPVFSLMRRTRRAEKLGLVFALVFAVGASLAVTAVSPLEYRWLLGHRVSSHAATFIVAAQMVGAVSLWLLAPTWPYIEWRMSGQRDARRFAHSFYARARDLESAGVHEGAILATFLADCRRRYLRSLLRPYSRHDSPVPRAYRGMGLTLCDMIGRANWPEKQANEARIAALAAERAFMRLMLWSANHDSRWAKRLLGRLAGSPPYPTPYRDRHEAREAP
jgi:hypothetical protein